MSYTVNIAEIQQGVTVTANTNLVAVTSNTQSISVLVNAVEFATGVTNAQINGAGNLIITLSNSTQLDAGQVVTSSTYGNTTVAAYLPTYSGSIGAATEIVTLTANAGAQSNQIVGANAAIVTANTAMKAYVDTQVTNLTANDVIQSSQIVGANAAIVTANTALKAYTDAQITTTQSWVTGANAAIVTANTAMKNYVDTGNTTQSTQITTTQSWVTGANAAIVTANTAMKNYVDAVTTAWTANAATQAGQIAGANAAIVTANTALKSYVDGQITTTQSWVTGANAATVTANTALKGYVDAQFTALTNGAPAILDTLGEIATSLGNNASLSTTLLNAIAGSNAAIVTANTAMKGYVDAQITTTQGQITTANTALKAYVDTQDSAITSAWTANAGVQAGQITGANAVVATLQANVGSFYTWANTNFGTSSYANANVASYLPVYGGNIAANAVTRAGFAWQFNTDGSESFPSATAVTTAAGKLWYDDTTGSWNAGMGGGNITQQIGEEIFVYGKASSAITDSPLQLIYKTGTVGASGVVTFAPTVAGITDTNLILGCATEAIALNGFGRVTSYGLVRGIATTGTAYGETWADDQDIYYNPATGGLTKTVPVAPGLKVYIGTVVNAASGGSGSFFVNIGAAGNLNSLSDVQTATNTAGQVLSYSSSSGYWKNTSLAAGTGVDITTYTNGNITIAGTYSNTNTAAYLAGGITVGNIASTSGYFWANGTVYSTGTGGGTSFDGNLTGNALTDTTNLRVLINASAYSAPTTTSTGTTSTFVTTKPVYTAGVLQTPAVNTTVGAVVSSNTAYQSGYQTTTNRTYTNFASYAQVWPYTANIMVGQDRVRGTNNQLDVQLNGKTWGTMSAASVGTLALVAQSGQTSVLGSGQAASMVGALGSISIVPAGGSANVQYATGQYSAINHTAGATGATASNIAYARLFAGAVAGQSGNIIVANAVALHTFNGWVSSNVSLVTNAYVILNEDTRSVISTVGNIAATGALSAFGNTRVNGYQSPNKNYYDTGTTGNIVVTASTAKSMPFQQIALNANATIYSTAQGVDTVFDFSIQQDGTGGRTLSWFQTGGAYTPTGILNPAPNSVTYARAIMSDTGYWTVSYSNASVPVLTVTQTNAFTGQAGQMVAVSNGTGKNNGQLAYWDVTNTRWSWVDTNLAVT